MAKSPRNRRLSPEQRRALELLAGSLRREALERTAGLGPSPHIIVILAVA